LPRSERYIADPEQLKIDFGNTPEAADAAAGLAEAVEEADLIPAHHRRKPRKKRDEGFPEHLPRETRVIDAPEAEKTCPTHGPCEQLPESMWHRRERLVFIPATLKVVEEQFIKYVCPNQSQCGVTMAELPTPLVEGDKYDASVAAQIITAKFAFHLPLYRQQDIFAGSGWTPARSTLLNILVAAGFVLAPLIEYFRRKLKEDRRIACDDTGVTLLYP
jgi:transposase